MVAATLGSVIAYGLALGIVHVLTGPDHLSALATLSVGKTWRTAFGLGVRWGCGHSFGLLIVAIIFFAVGQGFKNNLDNVTYYADMFVGFFMVLLGVWYIWKAWKDRSTEETRVSLRQEALAINSDSDENNININNNNNSFGMTTISMQTININNNKNEKNENEKNQNILNNMENEIKSYQDGLQVNETNEKKNNSKKQQIIEKSNKNTNNKKSNNKQTESADDASNDSETTNSNTSASDSTATSGSNTITTTASVTTSGVTDSNTGLHEKDDTHNLSDTEHNETAKLKSHQFHNDTNTLDNNYNNLNNGDERDPEIADNPHEDELLPRPHHTSDAILPSAAGRIASHLNEALQDLVTPEDDEDDLELGLNSSHTHNNSHHNNSHSEDSRRSKCMTRAMAFVAGVFHGIAGPGGVLGVMVALKLDSWIFSSLYMLLFFISSILTMGVYAIVYGFATARMTHVADNKEMCAYGLKIMSATFSIIVGVLWLSLTFTGTLDKIFD